MLFWGVDNYAQGVGRGLAERVENSPSVRRVVLFSAKDLQLAPTDAVKIDLGDSKSNAYRYRYDGLRLLFMDGGRYFLIPQEWTRQQGKLIVLPETNSIRLEFLH